jgi:Domain of unknown function (DUF4383)
MQDASPARLFTTVAGALLLVLGIVGFFYSASFGSPGDVQTALGLLRVNAWLNVLRIATGALALLLADYAPRPCSLALGLLYTGLAIWGFAQGGETILGLLPATGGDNGLHLLIGLLGLAATAATPSRAKSARVPAGDRARSPGERSEAGAKTAGQSP